MKNIIPLRGFTPKIGADCFIAPNAFLIGDIEVGDHASIWYNVTIRGDVMPIRIGYESNIQDGSVLHGTFEKAACHVGNRVTVGHQVTLHGCSIGDNCLIGMGSIIMDCAEIGELSLVGASSLVTEYSKFPPRSLILGRPAKVIRQLTDEEVARLRHSADNYLVYKTWYESEEL